MFKAIRITEQNRNMFLSVVDALTLSVCDIMIGAYDEKTGTACGILAAESINHSQLGYALAIRQIYVDENWRRKGAGSALVTALADISVDAGAKALLCYHLEAEEERDDVSGLLESLEFKRTKDALPVYAFRLSEMEAGQVHKDISCAPLKEVGKKQWREIIKLAEEQSAVLNVREYYDEDISYFAYDRSGDFRAALLFSFRDGVLYVDQIIAKEEEETFALETLLSQSFAVAQKKYSPGTEIGITLTAREQEMLLKELTGFKAEKVGSFIAHVLK